MEQRGSVSMTTMKDVAKKAGVGISTVSKVINNYPGVSEATRKNVEQVVAELNYVPNAIASALSSKSGRRVGLVIFIDQQSQGNDEVNMQYLFGAFNRAKELNVEIVTVFSTDFQNKTAEEIAQYFNYLRVQSLVVYGLQKKQACFFEFIRMQTLPTVLVDVPLQDTRISSVCIDHAQAQADLIEYMLAEQDQLDTALYLAGSKEGITAELQVAGVKKAIATSGISLTIYHADYSEKQAYELVKKHGQKADVIICASDIMAIGAVAALKELDIFRPVYGYGGISLLGYIDYKIVSVKQNFYTLSEEAINEVVHLMQDGKSRTKTVAYEIGHINYQDVIR